MQKWTILEQMDALIDIDGKYAQHRQRGETMTVLTKGGGVKAQKSKWRHMIPRPVVAITVPQHRSHQYLVEQA